MDEDTVAVIFLAGLFLTILTTPLLITGCIAAGNTRKWAAERRRTVLGHGHGNNKTDDVEADRLINSTHEEESESETEFLDSEDEEFYNTKRQRKMQEREEREADLRLSPRAKFFREWKKTWTGPGGSVEQRKQEQEFKDEESRRKIAREAVREYLRIERRRARKAAARGDGGKIDEGAELPTYGSAVKAEQ